MRTINILTKGLNGPRRSRCLALLIILLLNTASLSSAQTSRSAAAYYNRGNERYKKGDLDSAITDYDAALIFNPSWAPAYNMRGSARYKKGDLEGSITDFTKAIELDPHLALAHYNRGKARRDQGDMEGSIADYTTAIRFDSHLSSALNNRGNARREKGELEGALADLDKAVRLDPQNALFYNNRGLVKRDRGDLKEAIADYDRAIAINPRLAEAYSNRGNARQDRGEIEMSIADYESAIKIDPLFAKAYGNRGLARLFQGDTAGAAKDFAECLRLEPKLKPLLEGQIEKANRRRAASNITNPSSIEVVTLQALSYFERVQDKQFDNYLREIRPVELDPDLRLKVLNMLPKDDLVTPSTRSMVKLKVLGPILKYHHRDAVIELKVLRVPTATAVFLAGAAVLITEPALEILTPEELQAVVAHELGHEYYWNRFEIARQNHDSEMQELELRCDGIAVVTLQRVGVNPENLISAITKLNKYNERPESSSSQNYVALKERIAFIRSMLRLLRARSTRKDGGLVWAMKSVP